MSSIFFNKYSKNITVASNSYTETIGRLNGFIKHLIVRANTSTTIFDVKIYDSDDDVIIFERQGVNGEVNELLNLPTKGAYILQIDNSTKDEIFRVYLMVQELS